MPSDLHLILASSSPRRRLLLEEQGYSFDVVPPRDQAECGICSRETPPEVVSRLAWQKARDVAYRYEEGLILGADTVAECCGQILGKPQNREHASEMLRMMRNREHSVYSAFCLWFRPEDEVRVHVERTRLKMDDIPDDALEAYLDTDDWIGKAGAFGYQDGLDWIHILEGSESNVVGLPMEALAKVLDEYEFEE